MDRRIGQRIFLIVPHELTVIAVSAAERPPCGADLC